ncbi:MAG: hypothetical protein LJE70_03160, partial [Chromatiaceae bacterium]|nr:hypothetical protein [Chromatiaceae bacterium]
KLEDEGFRVRSLEFFRTHYALRDSVLTSIFAPYEVMIGCFERTVPGVVRPESEGCTACNV